MNFVRLLVSILRPTLSSFPHRPGVFVVILSTVFCAVTLHSQPSGANVISGTASVRYNGATTTVTAGNNSVLRWNSFDVAPSQTVQFIQPSANSRVLNWIGGLTPSQIDGTVRANGQVYLLNPAGVYFGKTAVIDAARLYAVAGSLSKEDFFAGNNRFTHLLGEVRNEGSLHASTVALIGRTVANSGTIVSPDGFVALAAGEQVYLGRKGSSIYVDTGASSAPGPAKVTSSPGVVNSGTIDAGKGSVGLASGDLYSVAISHTGRLRANDVRVQGKGKGDVLIGGEIDVSSSVNGRAGGYVEVTGERVALSATASINGSGAGGGGTILVGGDAHGTNLAVRNSQSTIVQKGATLRADATQRGDGGKIVVWSDGVTRYAGALSARGGGVFGNGGFAEVSGKQLTFAGTADLRAAQGRMGSLLLDPFNITINNGTDSELDFFDPNTYSPATNDSTISWSTLLTALANADVTVSTSNAEGGTQAGNITVAESPLAGAYNTARALTLLTAETGGIFVNAPVVNSGTGAINFMAGSGGITLRGSAGNTVLGTGGLLSLLSDGSLTGLGTVEAGTRVTLDLGGGAGSRSSPIVTSTPAITLGSTGSFAQVSKGPYFLANTHDAGVALNFASSAASGLDITSKDRGGLSDRPLRLTIPDNQSFSSLRLWGSDIAVAGPRFSVGTFSLGNSGTLTIPSLWSADTLTLENSGNVGSTFEQTFRATVSNLIFNKSGGRALVGSTRESVVVSGDSSNSDITIRASFNADRGEVIVGEGSLTARNIQIAGAVNGPGTLIATRRLELDGRTLVGRLDAPLSIKTPVLAMGKSVGTNNVYVANGLDAGLSVEGFTGGVMSVTSLDTARQNPAPMTISLNGLSGDVSMDLTSSSLTLSGSLTSPSVTLNHSGSITVANGGFTSLGRAIHVTADQLTLNGTGDVGTALFSIPTNSSVVTINQPLGGAVFLDNGTANLGINFDGFVGGGSFSGGDLAILSSSAVDVGQNSLSFQSRGSLNLRDRPITAETLTLAHDGALLGYTPPQVFTLVLGGAGDDGTEQESLSTFVSELILQKTGTAKVYLENASDLGLTLSGSSNSTVSIASVGFNREPVRAAPLTIGDFGLGSGGPTTLSSSTLTLDGGITSPSLTLNTTDGIGGFGMLTASTRLTLNGDGWVGTPDGFVSTNTPSLVLNKPTGAVFLDNGSAALSLTPTQFTEGGIFRTGDLVLDGSIDVGFLNDLTFASSGSIQLGDNSIRANILTLAHDGTLTIPSPTSLEMNTLVLGGSGDDGTASSHLALSTNNLLLSKTGAANVYIDNQSDFGLTVGASTPSVLSLQSLNTAGAMPAELVIDSGGLWAGGSLTLNSSSLLLSGSLTSPTVTLANTELVSGSGAIFASAGLTITGSGDFGTSEASISTTTPMVTVDKPAGGVFLDNGSLDLALSPTALGGGGRFAAGNLTLLAPIAAGSNSVSFTTAGTLDLGAHSITGDNVSFTHDGSLTGNGTINASQINLGGAGDVGTGDAPLHVQAPALLVDKSGGAIYVDNGSLDLALTPTSLAGGGAIWSGSLSLLGNVDATGNDLSFTTVRGINLGGNTIVADRLTLDHGDTLTNPGTITVNTLALRGTGHDGSASSHLVVSAENLQVNKQGAGNVYIDNRRDLGLTLDGSANATIEVSSLNITGGGASQLTIGSAGLTTNGGEGSSVVLNTGAITLSGDIAATNLTINNSGAMNGSGRLQAASQLNLGSTGDVGSSASPVRANTPRVALNKSAGAVYLDNGSAALSLAVTEFTGGGAFSSGSLELLSPIDVGSNDLAFTTTGEMKLGAFTVKANTVAFNNGGMLSGTGVVTATTLNLGRTGVVGTVMEPLLFSGGPTNVTYNRDPLGVNLGYFGRAGLVLTQETEGSVAANSQLGRFSENDDNAGQSESGSTSGSSRGRRSGGAAFRAISAKANLASATREQLQALGVYARPLRLEEKISREKKEAVFVAVPEREHPKESDFEVVEARIDPAALREVLRLAAETGLTDPGSPRLETVARSLSVSFAAFSAAHPSPEATTFRIWLETQRDAEAVMILGFVKSLRSTIEHIELLGLTHQELEVSKAQIFGNTLRTRLNADPDFLRALIEAPPPSTTAALSALPKDERVALR